MKRARYEAAWQFFVTKQPDRQVAYADVPWPLPNEDATRDLLRSLVLYGVY